jgi:hypothetical protein
MMRFNKPKSGRVKSPPGKVVSRRTGQRVWVFKRSTVPLRALFEALADGRERWRVRQTVPRSTGGGNQKCASR